MTIQEANRLLEGALIGVARAVAEDEDVLREAVRTYPGLSGILDAYEDWRQRTQEVLTLHVDPYAEEEVEEDDGEPLDFDRDDLSGSTPHDELPSEAQEHADRYGETRQSYLRDEEPPVMLERVDPEVGT